MRKLVYIFAVVFTFGTAMSTFTSCRDKSKVEKAADDVGDAVEDAVD
ncbi:MAG: hypothetical protein ABIO60_06590 [Aquaticitalea sp.]